MVELRSYTPKEIDRTRTTLLILDEASITCNTFRDIQKAISEDRFVILGMPNNEYQKGKRGFAKAHILASVSRNIKGVMALSSEEAIHELKKDWENVRINGSVDWRSSQSILSSGIAEPHALVIGETSNPFDIQMIERAGTAIKESNCWLDPAGVVFASGNEVLVEDTSTSFNDSHCTTIPVHHGELSLYKGERMIFCDSLHAERVGISHAAEKGISLRGTTMYVSKFPCRPCAQVVIAAGIERIVFEKDSYGLIETADLFEAHPITLQKITRN